MNSGLISPRLGQRALVVAEGVRAALAAGKPVRLEDWCDTP